MMKKARLLFIFCCIILTTSAQETFPVNGVQDYREGYIAFTHGTLHIGNGEVIEDGMVVFSNGKIINVGKYAPLADGKMIDCTGKQIYPGLILSSSNIGLSEIGAIRSEQDTHVETPRKAWWWYRHKRSRRNRNRNRQAYCARKNFAVAQKAERN